jgi:hypothetical protein
VNVPHPFSHHISFKSSSLNLLRPFITEYLTNELHSLLCDLVVVATEMMGDEIGSQQSTYESPVDADDDNGSEKCNDK